MARTDQVRRFVIERLGEEQIKAIFMDLNDTLREMAEEESMSLITRKAMVRSTIKALMMNYW